MIARLPRWAWAGGAVLALIGGLINVVGFLGFRHQAISHLTGTTSLLGAALAARDLGAIVHLGTVVLAFVAGAALGGFIVRDGTLRLGRRYGVVLAVESLLLVAAVPLMVAGQDPGIWLASVACGLQNAMVSTYSGQVVRTTHVSGMFTDLGILIGQRLRGTAVDVRRLRLYLLLIGFFLLGGVLGALSFARWQERTLYLPAFLTGLVGIAYTFYRHRHPPATAGGLPV
jgi:uncharacterized membrane protein YoaK (UPF0700 family)